MNDFTQIHHHPVRLHWTYSSGSLPARLVRPIFRLGYEPSYGWLEAPQAHVSSMRATSYCIWAVRTWRKACILVYGMRRKVYTLTGHTYPNLPFPFTKHFISSLSFILLTPWFMVFAHSPDQTYCVFRGVSGTWRVVVLCIRWVLSWFCLGGWYSCTCRSCIIPREQSQQWTATEPISMFSVSIHTGPDHAVHLHRWQRCYHAAWWDWTWALNIIQILYIIEWNVTSNYIALSSGLCVSLLLSLLLVSTVVRGKPLLIPWTPVVMTPNTYFVLTDIHFVS